MNKQFTSSSGKTFGIINLESIEWDILGENNHWIGFTHPKDEGVALVIAVPHIDDVSRNELLAYCNHLWKNKAFL
jgi:hypothetical protein